MTDYLQTGKNYFFIFQQIFFNTIDILIILVYNIIAGRNTLYTRVSELAFKRHGKVAGHGAAFGGFFLQEVIF